MARTLILILTVLLATLVACSHVAPVTESRFAARDLALSLDVIQAAIPVGTSPRFRLTLRNVSEHVCRVLDIDRRRDLQSTYYNLIVIKEGKPVEVPTTISDPALFQTGTGWKISPGGTRVFTLSHFPDGFDTLPPGVYQALC